MAEVTQAEQPAEDCTPSKRVKLEDVKLSSEEKQNNEKLQKVAKQLEYYFSDVNYVNDKFLLEEVKKENGWINITTLLLFQRLKQLTLQPEFVAKSLETHGTEGFLELSNCKTKVRRSKPLPDIEGFKKELELRTLHIAGFPLDSTFDDLHRFCERYGEVESVSMRRHFKTRSFKGCIMAVFKNQADAQKILDMQLLKLKDRELLKENLVDFYKRKEAKKEKYHKKRNNNKGSEKAEVANVKDNVINVSKEKEEPNEGEGEKQPAHQEPSNDEGENSARASSPSKELTKNEAE